MADIAMQPQVLPTAKLSCAQLAPSLLGFAVYIWVFALRVACIMGTSDGKRQLYT